MGHSREQQFPAGRQFHDSGVDYFRCGGIRANPWVTYQIKCSPSLQTFVLSQEVFLIDSLLKRTLIQNPWGLIFLFLSDNKIDKYRQNLCTISVYFSQINSSCYTILLGCLKITARYLWTFFPLTMWMLKCISCSTLKQFRITTKRIWTKTASF